jgi:hypothetical protein
MLQLKFWEKMLVLDFGSQLGNKHWDLAKHRLHCQDIGIQQLEHLAKAYSFGIAHLCPWPPPDGQWRFSVLSLPW